MHDDAKLPALPGLDTALRSTAALRNDVGAIRIPVEGATATDRADMALADEQRRKALELPGQVDAALRIARGLAIGAASQG